MPTPKQDEQRLSYGDQLRTIAETWAQALENNTQIDAGKLEDLNDEQNRVDAILIDKQQTANKAYKESVETAYKDYYKLLEGAYKERENAYKSEQAAVTEQARKDANKAQWMGLTEVVANIANAIGVANGASNQTIKTYSRDWMQQADNERQSRYKHLAQAREKLYEQKSNLDKAKLDGVLAAANIDRDQIKQILDMERDAANAYIAGEREIAEVQARRRDDADKVRYEGGVKGAAADEADAKEAARIAAKSGSSSSSSSSSSQGGINIPRDAFPVTVGDKTYWMDKNSIIATMNANTDYLSKEDMASIQGIIGDNSLSAEQRAYKLLPFIKKYPQLEQAMANSAYYVKVNEQTQQAQTQTPPAQKEQTPAERREDRREERREARQQRREERREARQKRKEDDVKTESSNNGTQAQTQTKTEKKEGSENKQGEERKSKSPRDYSTSDGAYHSGSVVKDINNPDKYSKYQ